MWITILNANETKVPKKREGEMLWSVILFADDIIWSSAHAYLACQKHYFVFCDDRFRVNMFKYYMQFWKTPVTPEQLEKNYQSYIKAKKKRHKRKVDMDVVVKGKDLLNAFEKTLMSMIDANLRELGVLELASLMNIYRSHRRKEAEVIALACFVPHHPKLKKEDTDVGSITDIMMTGFEVPLFSSEIESLLSFKEFDTKIKKDFFAKGKINAVRELFLEFVSPESLTSKQVQIIRNELNEKSRELTNAVGEFNDDLCDKKLTADKMEEIKARYIEKLKPLINDFQQVIDNNIYMIQLKNKEDNPKMYRLYLMLTTVRNIVGLYEGLKIINKESAIYCRDELHQKGLLDALKFFLYLKVEE